MQHFQTCPKSVLETKLCEKYADFHFAMKSRQDELNYLRGVGLQNFTKRKIK